MCYTEIIALGWGWGEGVQDADCPRERTTTPALSQGSSLGPGEKRLSMAAAAPVSTTRGGVHVPQMQQVQVCLSPALPSQSEECTKLCTFPSLMKGSQQCSCTNWGEGVGGRGVSASPALPKGYLGDERSGLGQSWTERAGTPAW